MKIYIVTSGTYSDYEIEAVFTTEEKAKAYIDKHGDYDNRQIEEYDADSENLERETAVYEVIIDKDICKTVRKLFIKPDTIRAFLINRGSNINRYYGYVLTVETDGAERAKKIASERLAQVKAMPYLFPRLYEECVESNYRGYKSLDFPTYSFHTKEIILSEKEKIVEVKKLFRHHRGGLAESLATTIEVKDLADMREKIEELLGDYYSNIRIKNEVMIDDRLPREWENVSYYVIADFADGGSGCIGMCNFYEE